MGEQRPPAEGQIRMGAVSALRTWVRGADRLLLASGLAAIVAVGWFAVNLWRPTGPPVLLWLPVPIGGAIVVAVFWRVSRTETLPLPARQFWRRLTVGAGLTAVSMTSQAVDVLARPGIPGQRVGMVMHVLDAAAVLVVLYALYRL